MKKEYKGYRIKYEYGYYWWEGEAFGTLQLAKDAIDAYLSSEADNYSDDDELFSFWED